MAKITGWSLVVTIGILSGYLFSRFYLPKMNRAGRISPNQEIKKTEVVPVIAKPKSFSIPKINIITSIESVNLDNQGRMDVPKDANNVAWYEWGPKPGEIGSAVIDGHLDSVSGPAVFWHLDKLEKGDVIKVTDENGRTYNFSVDRKEVFNDSSFPIQLVFNTKDKARLNLITCHGVYDRNAKNYNQREVIFSELMNK